MLMKRTQRSFPRSVDAYFKGILDNCITGAWRKVAPAPAESGIPMPCMTSALNVL
ncbi:hypothetical protein O9929_21315 [Vibrio lentus]|nr:hypothetical protein [Vibrio lentus]